MLTIFAPKLFDSTNSKHHAFLTRNALGRVTILAAFQELTLIAKASPSQIPSFLLVSLLERLLVNHTNDIPESPAAIPHSAAR